MKPLQSHCTRILEKMAGGVPPTTPSQGKVEDPPKEFGCGGVSAPDRCQSICGTLEYGKSGDPLPRN